MKKVKYLINRLFAYLYFKTITQDTLQRTVDKHINSLIDQEETRIFPPIIK